MSGVTPTRGEGNVKGEKYVRGECPTPIITDFNNKTLNG